MNIIITVVIVVVGLILFSILGSLLANAPVCGLIAGIAICLLVAYFILSIEPRPEWVQAEWANKGLLSVLRTVAIILLVVTVPALVFGFLAPELKASLERLSKDKALELSFALDKRSLKTEAESGSFTAITKSDTRVYDKGGVALTWPGTDEPLILKSGNQVMILDFKHYRANKESEGLVHVMVVNRQTGDFINGPVVWIPASKILED